MIRNVITTTGALVVLAGAVVGCGSADAGDEAVAGSSPSTSTPVDALSGGWEEVVPGGDCECSDGSAFSFWSRRGDPAKVVVFLQGGGACFSAETCAPENELYRTAVTQGPNPEGVLDFENPHNPFADYSAVYIPYCTGDVHIGNVTTEYAEGLTIHHKGYANGTAALEHVAATFPDATDVVVLGESAGSIAAPLYAGLVSDRLPDAQITVVADGSGSYPDDPALNEILAVWGAGDVVPAWFDPAGLSVPGLFVQSGHHAPDMVFARHDFGEDENQASWYPYLGVPVGDLLARMETNEEQIEAAGVDVHSYVAPGDDHTVLGDAGFYDEAVAGQPLVDWVTKLIAGEPVGDVR